MSIVNILLFQYTSNNVLGISEPKFTDGQTSNFLHYNLMRRKLM